MHGAAQAFAAALRPDGTWPSFLAAGWLGAAVLYRQEMYYESAPHPGRARPTGPPSMTPADAASMASALRRVGLSPRTRCWSPPRRLAATQRSDGGWASDDGQPFDVHTTLTAIRAFR